jgi:hypothetical protein
MEELSEQISVTTIVVLFGALLILSVGGACSGFLVSCGLALMFLSMTPILWGWPIGAGIGAILGLLPIYVAFRNHKRVQS